MGSGNIFMDTSRYVFHYSKASVNPIGFSSELTTTVTMCYAQIAETSKRPLQRPNPVCKSKESLFKVELGLSICLMHWHNWRASSSVGVEFFFFYIMLEVGVKHF